MKSYLKNFYMEQEVCPTPWKEIDYKIGDDTIKPTYVLLSPNIAAFCITVYHISSTVTTNVLDHQKSWGVRITRY